MNREYRPLDGQEIALLALRLLSEALAKDQTFKEHRCFNSGTLTVTVKGLIEPAAQDPLVKEIKIEIGDGFPDLTKSIVLDSEAARDFGKTQEGAPDALRIELGLPLLEPSPGAAGQLVDKPRPSKGQKA